MEYLRALDKGEVIENRNGFVARAGFCRAIDAIIDSSAASEPPTDEAAIEHLQAEELREAIGQLSAEEQQVLSLHYFEEQTAEASAEAHFCSLSGSISSRSKIRWALFVWR